MTSLRQKALELTLERKPVIITASKKTSDYYGMLVFDDSKMQKYLPKEAYLAIKGSIDKGSKIDNKVADMVATGMKAWAIEMGATHYTHWFQPLTEGTAEKHDSFMDPIGGGKVIENFSGKLLVQQEPDASSFPNGGIRSTFEARGYTAWDPSSPAFIMDDTLCIPTIFISYTGELLDNKAPLLKALAAVDKAAVDVCHYFDKDVQKVISYLGWEQEYFLIDTALFDIRPDLVLTDRSLLGKGSAKNQQLEDQYFGTIPERVQEFMKELEIEGYKLGLPLKTRHNEVAPNQFEVAPVYAECNLAVDQNLLTMILMRRIAKKHNFKCVMHEKPFKGVNGSGKHNNWSLGTDTGINLLQPGKNPKSNLIFLTFLANVFMAVYKYEDLLKASIASAGNAHRLGANEAPPAIISVFMGGQLTKMIDSIVAKLTDHKMSASEKTELKLDIGRIPELILDSTDRNRTSPFAFTGNKFEFRAVGSAANCSSPMTVLNTAMASTLVEFKKEVDALITKGTSKEDALLQIIRKFFTESKPIRFDGNNYSDEWKAEAKKRGLNDEGMVPKILELWNTPKAKKLFESMKVLSNVELEARTEVKHELFIKKLDIEAKVLTDMVMNQIIPVCIDYQTSLIENVKGLKDIFGESGMKEIAGNRIELIKEMSTHITSAKKLVKDMEAAIEKVHGTSHAKDGSIMMATKVSPYFEQIRDHIDALEGIVDDAKWPLPKYRELLFIR